MKTRSAQSDEDGSAIKSPIGFQIYDEPVTATKNQQQSQRSATPRVMNTQLKLSDSYDSIYSPFFLHSADHPGLTIVVHTLDGTNYNSWSIAMKISLEAKNKLSFVDGSLPRPSVDDSLFKIWSRCNSMVKSWILNVVSKEIYDSILYYQDAAEMWDDLFRRFKVNNLPRKYQLEQAVMTLKQGELDLSTYFTKKKILWEQLANTKSSVVKKCDCEQVQELLEEAETSRIIQSLMGLNDSFNNVRGQILNMKPRPGLNDIYNMLDQDESQRVLGGTQRQIPTPTAFQNQASAIEQNPVLLAHGNFQKPKCSHCSRIGHTVDKCYKVHGYPPGHPRAKKNNSVGNANLASVGSNVSVKDQGFDEASNNLSKDQLQQMIAYFSSKLQSSGVTPCSEKSIASTSSSVPMISQISGTFLSLYNLSYYDMLTSTIPKGTELSLSDWIIDSGASHHVTHNRSLYSDYQPLENTFVTLPNGYTVKISGTGYVQLTDAISLYSVLHIPEFKFNLLSVSVITKSLNSQVSFTSDSCFIQALTQELMIGRGSQVANLYVLDHNKTHANLVVQSPGNVSVCSSIVLDPLTWHKRLGHPSMKKINSLSEILLIPKEKDVKHSKACHVCHLSKQKRIPFVSRNHLCSKPLELIHIDTWGPFAVPTIDGYRYFLTIVDDFSRATWVYMLKQKSDVLHVFPGYIEMIENQLNTRVRAVRSDNANELNFTVLYHNKGIKAFHSCPDTPEQNSVVERKHQHLLNVARALIFQSGVPLEYWGDCVLTATFLINRLPSPVLGNKTPYEKLTSKIPEYHLLKTFGCLCYVSTSPKSRNKFEPRARACVFLGYPAGYKGYKLLDIETRSVSISRHVIFYEDIFPFASSHINEDVKSFFPHLHFPAPIDVSVPLVHTSSDTHLPRDELSSVDTVQTELRSTRQKKKPSHLQDFHCYNNSSIHISDLSIPSNTQTLNHTSPYPIINYISYSYLSEPFRAFTNIITPAKIPTRISEALEDKIWRDSIGKEIGAFIRTGTWSITELPPGKEAVGCKWLHTIKYHADGTVERPKSRLVAKGYTQQEGIDYNDTFSPVAKLVTVKLVFGLAAKMNWFLRQLDISNAFLNGDLDEEIYMKVPPGYAEIQGEEISPTAVCRLHKSIYGLKQASRQWFLKFSTTLMALGFEQCPGEHTLFLQEQSGFFVVVSVYVDDIIIASTRMEDAQGLVEKLASAFQLRDLGVPKFFLGIEVARSSEGISINQRKYVLDLLEATGFSDCKPSSIPMEPNQKLSKEEGVVLEDRRQYRKLIGKLQYLTITRPDITFAVSKLSQFASEPRDTHLKALHKVLRYLKGSIGQGLLYGTDNNFDLRAFSDSDWGACTDDRRSVTGYAMFLGNSLVSWRSKKQDTVSLSSAEAEFRAMCVASKEILWLTQVLKFLRVPFKLPAYLYGDNTAALHIASNSVFHERTKHVEFDCYKVRECIVKGIVKTMFVRTGDQLADMLTKALYPAPFRNNMSKMGVINIYAPPS